MDMKNILPTMGAILLAALLGLMCVLDYIHWKRQEKREKKK